MRDVTCGEVRTYLAGLAAGSPSPPDPDVWQSMVTHGAVTGPTTQPQLTPVGQHVLEQLSLLGYRTDRLSLTMVSERLARLFSDMDGVAKTAEYFLAELGPVAPAEALPLLRPVAIDLANRREPPEDLAVEFRNTWGSVEVLGGDPRDRLVAGQLLHDSEVAVETVYAPLMNTINRVREIAGPNSSASTIAALLHLTPAAGGAPALDAFVQWRAATRASDEAAALLAGVFPEVGPALERREALRKLLDPSGNSNDAMLAASLLTAVRPNPEEKGARCLELAAALGTRFARPMTPASLLALRSTLAPAELVHWLDVAAAYAKARQLAPSTAELNALGLALVFGVPRDHLEFDPAMAATAPVVSRVERMAATVALTVWIYRPLTSPATAKTTTPAAAA
ncbi:MAG: hypothetical protein L3J87_05020 [Thermoplasmata archaeon]|nr:hypothetical protein [Thermoplasmata archaeon]MCI4344967.1 hypothetical protein [Thermoplasmata archaeon]